MPVDKKETFSRAVWLYLIYEGFFLQKRGTAVQMAF